MSELALLTQSRLGAARACQRLHHIKYELGYRALVELGGRRFGTLVHRGLEAYWNAVKDGARADIALLRALTAVSDEPDEFERVKAEVLLSAYAKRWDPTLYEVLGVEVEFQAALQNPRTGAASRTWLLAGKLDVILRERDTGRIVFMEHKTSAEDITPGSSYWRRLRMDTQVSVYFVGAASLGYEAEECIYDVIGKPAIRPLKATPLESRKYKKDTGELYANQRAEDETPEEYGQRLSEAIAAEPERYLARGSVVRLGAEMDDALADIWDTAKQIQEAKIANRNPRNPSACMQYGHACDFFDVCSGAAALDDSSQFIRSDNVHPELAAAQPKRSEEESRI